MKVGWRPRRRPPLGQGHVDPQWSTLIQQALDDRRLGWDPQEPPRPGSVKQTLAFLEYVQRRVGVWRGSR
jgi:hypothetical protein